MPLSHCMETPIVLRQLEGEVSCCRVVNGDVKLFNDKHESRYNLIISYEQRSWFIKLPLSSLWSYIYVPLFVYMNPFRCKLSRMLLSSRIRVALKSMWARYLFPAHRNEELINKSNG